jgi:uncharacterized pyridoxal phosphate-containing UPF0001 family protein
MNVIQVNLNTIEQNILNACQRAGRKRSEVNVLLATKTIL